MSYRQRLSGPLLDRIDMTIEVARLPVEKLIREDSVAASDARPVGAGPARGAGGTPVAEELAREGTRELGNAGSIGGSPVIHTPEPPGTGGGGAGGGGTGSGGISVPLVTFENYAYPPGVETSAMIKARVMAARERQTERQGAVVNAALSSRQVKAYCRLSEPCQALLTRAVERLGLSARAYERIRKVARTIADLDGAVDIEVPHLAEAIQYRSGEERLRG
jgi:predicted ATPase with chaperone activity